MSKYIIEDWAGNVMKPKSMMVHYKNNISSIYSNDLFDSFEDAEDFLCELLDEKYEEDRGEYYITEIESEDDIRESNLFLDAASRPRKVKVKKKRGNSI